MTVTETATPALGKLDATGRELLFTAARTANSFSAEPVTDTELSEIWELARWSPSAANTQPLRVLYVRTDEGKARLVEHMNDGNKAKTASAPAVAVLALDTRYHEHIPTVFPVAPQLFDAFEADPQMRDGSGRFSAAIQTGFFLQAIRAVGLAAGPMAGFDGEALDADFFPDGRWKSVLVVNIGHPGENPWFPRLPRLDHSEVLAWA